MTNTAAFHFGEPLLENLDMLEVKVGYPLNGGKRRKSNEAII